MFQEVGMYLNVEPSTLKEFKDMICKDFCSPGSYLTYILQTVSNLATLMTNTFPTKNDMTHIPSFSQRLCPGQNPPCCLPTWPACIMPPTTPELCYSDPHCPPHCLQTTGMGDQWQCQDHVPQHHPGLVNSKPHSSGFCHHENRKHLPSCSCQNSPSLFFCPH